MEDIQNLSYKVFKLPPESDFKLLDTTLRSKMDLETRDINPIIYKLMIKILKACAENFDFMQYIISYNEYLEFYQEINRHFAKKTKKIITTEATSKAFFVGDLHGAIEETFLLIDYFYEQIVDDPDIRIVFVGDYVDRNPYDLETLTLVLAFYLLFPENVTLLRGNHETREINEHYGFYDNLLRSFRDKAEELYSEIINIFKKLPLMNLVKIYSQDSNEARVLVLHGGIPINLEDPTNPVLLDNLEDKIQSEVEKTDDLDEYSTSILWSDPDEMIDNLITGPHLHGRSKFGTNIFNLFMDENKLDLLIRGHQKWNDGVHIFFGKLYSLFSTSTYDGKKRFKPKFLCLEYGKEPQIIPITAEFLNFTVK
jgi:hypothetical protein